MGKRFVKIPNNKNSDAKPPSAAPERRKERDARFLAGKKQVCFALENQMFETLQTFLAEKNLTYAGFVKEILAEKGYL